MKIADVALCVFEELTKDGSLHFVPLYTSMPALEYRKFKDHHQRIMLQRITDAIKKGMKETH